MGFFMKSTQLIKLVLSLVVTLAMIAPFTFLKEDIVATIVELPSTTPLAPLGKETALKVKPLATIASRTKSKPVVKKVPENPLHQMTLPDFAAISDTKQKKKQFFNYMKPAVNKQNQHLLAQRAKLLQWLDKINQKHTLTKQEQQDVIKTIVSANNNRLPLVLGVGGNNTTQVVEDLKTKDLSEFDAILSVSPYYNKPTQEGLYLHFKAIAEAVDVDQILYNVPGRTSVDMLNETVARLADIPNITGVKDATGDVARGKVLVELVGDRMAVYSGDDATAVELILLGAKGNVSVTANVSPKDMADMCRLALEGKADEARAINQRLAALNSKLFVEANPIPVKWALQQLGLIQDGIRLPLTPLSQAYHQDVLAALKSAGAL